MIQLETDYKLNVYNALVNEAKAESDVCKQAIAFLVEAMSTIYPLDQSKVLLQGLIEQVKKEPTKATQLLDQQIATAYEGFLALKLPNDRANRDCLISIYNGLKNARDTARSKGRQESFGGIPDAYVPSWYPKK